MAHNLVNLATVDILGAAGRKIGDLKRNLIRFPPSTPLMQDPIKKVIGSCYVELVDDTSSQYGAGV